MKWKYIELLHDLQEKEELHLANKLRAAHIAWIRKKMNVKLAAQLLSESVGTSLRYCLDENIGEFSGCEATIDFIVLFNNLFDIMNSRNLKSRGYKCPVQKRNIDQIKDFLVIAETYIRSLKFSDGQDIINTKRKTGFLGFLFCIRSLQIIYERYISAFEAPLTFLLTYKLSQDHIELFFGQIRSMGGANNNPTVRQFSAAYKKLLVHNDIMDVVKGNCLTLKSVPILTVASTYGNNASIRGINMSLLRNKVLDDCDTDETNNGDDEYVCLHSKQYPFDKMCKPHCCIYCGVYGTFFEKGFTL